MATKKPVSVEQRFELLAKLSANVAWDSLDSDLIQQIIDQPRLSGQNFTIFLLNGARLSLGDLRIVPTLFDPVRFIGAGWKIVTDEHDSQNDGVTEVDFDKVRMVTCLKEGETSITGEEKLRRLKEGNLIRYGDTTFMGLWKDYQARKKYSVLEMLFRAKSVTYMDFFGDILLGPSGDRCVLYLCRNDDGNWYWHYYWLDVDCNAKYWSLVSSR